MRETGTLVCWATADNVTLINQQKYAESLAGKLGELSAVWESIGDEAISSGFLKGLADLGVGVSSLIEKFGLLKSVIASVGIAAFAKNYACPEIIRVHHKTSPTVLWLG